MQATNLHFFPFQRRERTQDGVHTYTASSTTTGVCSYLGRRWQPPNRSKLSRIAIWKKITYILIIIIEVQKEPKIIKITNMYLDHLATTTNTSTSCRSAAFLAPSARFRTLLRITNMFLDHLATTKNTSRRRAAVLAQKKNAMGRYLIIFIIFLPAARFTIKHIWLGCTSGHHRHRHWHRECWEWPTP
jgi:hypothetical protein